jgi:hypothetical protein
MKTKTVVAGVGVILAALTFWVPTIPLVLPVLLIGGGVILEDILK